MSTPAPGSRIRVEAWYERLTLFRAVRTIVIVAIVLMVAGGVLVRLIEPEVFTDIGLSFWWAVTTVTTVGYGDIVPESTAGRIVGAALMLCGVSLIPLVTSVAVSILTAKRANLLHEEEAERRQELADRLDRIEELLRQR